MEFENIDRFWQEFDKYEPEELGSELFNAIKVLIYNKLVYNVSEHLDQDLDDCDDLADFYSNMISISDIPTYEDLEKIFIDFPDFIEHILDMFNDNITSAYEEESGDDSEIIDLDAITIEILLQDTEDYCYDFAIAYLDELERF